MSGFFINDFEIGVHSYLEVYLKAPDANRIENMKSKNPEINASSPKKGLISPTSRPGFRTRR